MSGAKGTRLNLSRWKLMVMTGKDLKQVKHQAHQWEIREPYWVLTLWVKNERGIVVLVKRKCNWKSVGSKCKYLGSKLALPPLFLSLWLELWALVFSHLKWGYLHPHKVAKESKVKALRDFLQCQAIIW